MTFAEFVRLTRAYWWFLVLLTALGAGVMIAKTSREPELYSAGASGIVKVGFSSSAGEEMSNQSLASDKAALYVALANTTPVAERVVEKLGLDVDPGAIAGRFSASVDTDINLLTVQAIGTTPEEARDLASIVVQAIADEAEEIENTGRPAGNKAETLVQVVPLEQAQLPGAPFTPNYRNGAIKGAGGGLVLAYVILIARRLIDRRIRSVKDVETATGSAVIGIIPKVDALNRTHRGVRGDLGQAAEAFRQLRTNLRFLDVDNPPRRIVITSALASEGKSTVSSNLARLVAQAGEKVVLIDADLRRPMLATTFDIDGEVGLTQVLAGDLRAGEAMVSSGIDNLWLLPAGRIPPNPSELLGSLRMSQLIDELARTHLVLLDAPPLLPVTDAGLLSAFCDGALLVQATGQTYIEQSEHCRRILDQVGSRLLGIVLNKAPLKGVGAIAYGDGYGYGGYGAQAEYASREAYSTAGKGKRRSK
ncbi:polysaccharide biosynthesis tyrosine autokinase [Nocardioides currus]|uniref:CobQ/CobB/MinD/ParA nucleotide binding domain-containing protein n=1 Tax=Nocardioides currus TaxID=2133958 RepID=A0A2R7Z032_9ACTN|nr:polysaccharide biosynthesis tyrosine autokinase [Nocardioides currus]PUA81519.1 hypothetical protein C7S10_05405 [Nocardioides currus]